jgi:hypothetical protein
MIAGENQFILRYANVKRLPSRIICPLAEDNPPAARDAA